MTDQAINAQNQPSVSAKALAESLAASVLERREKRLLAKQSHRPKLRTYASSIPTCLRCGVYEITHWDQKKQHDTWLLARFEVGNKEESVLISELMALGFDVCETQVSIDKGMIEQYRISGYIDGKIKWEGRRLPFEVKSMNPNRYESVNTVQDLLDDPFLIRYFRQMQIYMLGTNEEVCLLFLTDCLGHWKIIVVDLDYQRAEEILKMVEAINQHIDAKTLPDRIPYDHDMCGKCDFVHVCCPDIMQRASVEFKDDKMLEGMLDERGELEMAAKKFKKLDEIIKERLREHHLACVGKWTISGKWQPTTKHNYPEDVKKQYSFEDKVWKTKIVMTETEEK